MLLNLIMKCISYILKIVLFIILLDHDQDQIIIFTEQTSLHCGNIDGKIINNDFMLSVLYKHLSQVEYWIELSNRISIQHTLCHVLFRDNLFSRGTVIHGVVGGFSFNPSGAAARALQQN